MTETLTPKTTVGTLLKEYPFLLDYLAGYHDEFAKLKNPVLRHTAGRMVTLDKVAATAGVPVERLLDDIAGQVAAVTGGVPMRSTTLRMDWTICSSAWFSR